MSFIHNTSTECAKDQLDVFGLPPTQLSVEDAEVVRLKPVSSLDNEGPIEFNSVACAEEYTDLFHTYLYLLVTITKADGTAIDENDKVASINNSLHSVISDISVQLGNKIVTPTSQYYPYKAYLETLFNYNDAAKDTHLGLSLYYKDTAGKFDAVNAENSGFSKRKSFFDNGKIVSLYGKLSLDIFGQNKYLINGVPFTVTLSRAKPSFCLMAEGNEQYKLKIIGANLFVRRLKVSPELAIAQAKVLRTTTAKYPINRTEIKSFTVPANLQSFSLDNLVIGQIPVRVIIGLVKNSALNGEYKRNPFNFEHFNLIYLGLTRDGVNIHSSPFAPRFSGGNPDYVLSYFSTFLGVNIGVSDDGWSTNRDEYPNGYCLHAWDLTSDQSADVHQWSLRKNGSLGVELRFSTPLVDPISCIIYTEYQNLIEIDSDRRVSTDY